MASKCSVATGSYVSVNSGFFAMTNILVNQTGRVKIAAVEGRAFVLPDDVKRMVPPVLAHRLILKPESRLRRVTVESVLNEILMDVAVPVLHHKKEQVDEWRD